MGRNGYVHTTRVVYRQVRGVWQISRTGGPFKDWVRAALISEEGIRDHLAMAFPKLDVCRYRGQNKPAQGTLLPGPTKVIL